MPIKVRVMGSGTGVKAMAIGLAPEAKMSMKDPVVPLYRSTLLVSKLAT